MSTCTCRHVGDLRILSVENRFRQAGAAVDLKFLTEFTAGDSGAPDRLLPYNQAAL